MADSKRNTNWENLPPLNALRSFEVVAREGSFAAAASCLHVTHWAVGKQIRLLENWLGVALFERHARGVVLTDEGVALRSDVIGAFERLAGAGDRLRRDTGNRRVSGTVRVNVLVSFAVYWLLPRLSHFREQYPDIDIKISTSSRKLRYVGDAFDIGIRSGPEHGAGLISRTLMPDARVPACSPLLLRQHPVHKPEDLRHHTLLHSASTRAAWGQWLKGAGAPGLQPVRHVEFDHAHLQIAAATEGLGVTLASLPLIERDVAGGRLVCPIPAPVLQADDYFLVVNEDRRDDEAVMAFEGWITERANRG